jgi:hypothetical protein
MKSGRTTGKISKKFVSGLQHNAGAVSSHHSITRQLYVVDRQRD